SPGQRPGYSTPIHLSLKGWDSRVFRHHPMSPPPEQPVPCSLCERPFSRSQLTKPHCLPKSRGGTADDVERLCSQCHGMVHATFTNNTLAALYPPIDQLHPAPDLA